MAKITAWLITLVGLLLILPLIKINIGSTLSAWLIALAWLIIGITKLMRNYQKRKK